MWWLLACTETYVSGANELITVRDGTFFEGDHPASEAATTPAISYASSVGYVITQGQGNITYSGIATADSYSVAVSFPGASTGYWVVPVGAPDVTQENALSFSLTLDFTPEVPYGLQELAFSAIDDEGHPSALYTNKLCVLPDDADNNLAACSEDVTPQNAVISLSWDTPVDLDLIVVAPNGKVVSWKAPSTVIPAGDKISSDELGDPSTGQLSRDSNGNCNIDAINLESLIFPGEPVAGDYRVYANLYSACGQKYTNFELNLLRRVDAEDGTHPVETTFLGQGQLLAAQATPEAELGTYLTTITLP